MLFENKSSGADWILAGLGNPGEKYARTRHNMGFLTVDLLAEKQGVKLNKVKFKSAYNILRFGGARVLVMKPQTFMNLSGEAVQEAAQFYKIPADHVVVIYDDVSLPVGKLRVRPSGSAGGHNGIKNIIAHLGTDQFPRVKNRNRRSRRYRGGTGHDRLGRGRSLAGRPEGLAGHLCPCHRCGGVYH